MHATQRWLTLRSPSCRSGVRRAENAARESGVFVAVSDRSARRQFQRERIRAPSYAELVRFPRLQEEVTQTMEARGLAIDCRDLVAFRESGGRGRSLRQHAAHDVIGLHASKADGGDRRLDPVCAVGPGPDPERAFESAGGEGRLTADRTRSAAGRARPAVER